MKAGDCMDSRVYGGFHGGGFSGGAVGPHIGFGGYYVSPGVFSGLGGYPGYGGSGRFLDILHMAPHSLWGVLLVFM
ncbi:hypothetical protein OE903_05680 [Bacillus sp. B6(2022)]|nr:hypothetical protein [Bacillus sp. B6(2022)]